MNDEIWLVIGVSGAGVDKIENPLGAFPSMRAAMQHIDDMRETLATTQYIADMREEPEIEELAYRVVSVPLFEGWAV